MKIAGVAMLAAGVIVASTLLSGCDRSPRQAVSPAPEQARPLPKALPTAAQGGDDPYAGVTAMAQRVAVLGLLNKRNGLVREVTLTPGESIRIGRAVVRLRACERTAQWESPQEVGAFVQLLTLDHRSDRWRSTFSGWLFRERPDRNVVQHPIYDVFIKSCAMQWPGEVAISDTAAAPGGGTGAAPNSRSSADQSPTAPVAPPTPDATGQPAGPATAPLLQSPPAPPRGSAEPGAGADTAQ